jgi:hypothetical protein
MKKSMLAVLGAVALFGSLVFSTETMAQSWRYGNNPYNNSGYSNVNNQHYSLQELHSRIDEGLRSGQLTRQEAYSLKQKENSIRRQEFIAKRDGFISYQEQASLNRQIDQLAKDIFKEKHDFQNTYNSSHYGRR